MPFLPLQLRVSSATAAGLLAASGAVTLGLSLIDAVTSEGIAR